MGIFLFRIRFFPCFTNSCPWQAVWRPALRDQVVFQKTHRSFQLPIVSSSFPICLHAQKTPCQDIQISTIQFKVGALDLFFFLPKINVWKDARSSICVRGIRPLSKGHLSIWLLLMFSQKPPCTGTAGEGEGTINYSPGLCAGYPKIELNSRVLVQTRTGNVENHP